MARDCPMWARPRSGDITTTAVLLLEWSETTSTATCLLLCCPQPHYRHYWWCEDTSPSATITITLYDGVLHSHNGQWGHPPPPTHSTALLGSLYWRKTHCCSTNNYLLGVWLPRSHRRGRAPGWLPGWSSWLYYYCCWFLLFLLAGVYMSVSHWVLTTQQRCWRLDGWDSTESKDGASQPVLAIWSASFCSSLETQNNHRERGGQFGLHININIFLSNIMTHPLWESSNQNNLTSAKWKILQSISTHILNKILFYFAQLF